MSENYLDLCNINVRSLSDQKLNGIKAELLLDFDLFCITETNLPHARVTDLDLPGFHPIIRKDRQDRTWGGVALYAAEHISATRVYDYEIPDLEALWVKVKAGSNTLMVCVCYRPPNSNVSFWEKLQESLDLANVAGSSDIVLAGDFNADPNSRHGRLLKLFCESNNLTMHVKEPTRITPNKASILDHIISNVPSLVKATEVLDPISTCDHCPVKLSLELKNKYNKPAAFKRHVWDYKQSNVEEFQNELCNFNWDLCFSNDDVNLICRTWTDSFMDIAKKCIPNRIITVRPCDRDFYTPELRQLRRKKNRIHRKAKETNSPHYDVPAIFIHIFLNYYCFISVSVLICTTHMFKP